MYAKDWLSSVTIWNSETFLFYLSCRLIGLSVLGCEEQIHVYCVESPACEQVDFQKPGVLFLWGCWKPLHLLTASWNDLCCWLWEKWDLTQSFYPKHLKILSTVVFCFISSSSPITSSSCLESEVSSGGQSYSPAWVDRAIFNKCYKAHGSVCWWPSPCARDTPEEAQMERRQLPRQPPKMCEREEGPKGELVLSHVKASSTVQLHLRGSSLFSPQSCRSQSAHLAESLEEHLKVLKWGLGVSCS